MPALSYIKDLSLQKWGLQKIAAGLLAAWAVLLGFAIYLDDKMHFSFQMNDSKTLLFSIFGSLLIAVGFWIVIVLLILPFIRFIGGAFNMIKSKTRLCITAALVMMYLLKAADGGGLLWPMEVFKQVWYTSYYGFLTTTIFYAIPVVLAWLVGYKMMEDKAKNHELDDLGN